jgi:hypothetical protein
MCECRGRKDARERLLVAARYDRQLARQPVANA